MNTYTVTADVNNRPVILTVQATDWQDAQEQFFDLYEFTSDGLPNCIGDITIY